MVAFQFSLTSVYRKHCFLIKLVLNVRRKIAIFLCSMSLMDRPIFFFCPFYFLRNQWWQWLSPQACVVLHDIAQRIVSSPFFLFNILQCWCSLHDISNLFQSVSFDVVCTDAVCFCRMASVRILPFAEAPWDTMRFFFLLQFPLCYGQGTKCSFSPSSHQ